MTSPIARHPFGQHVRSLRRARGFTQERLAAAADLSPDTIRRLEHGAFSPSLDTLVKLCTGLSISILTLFESFTLGEIDEAKLLLGLVERRTPREVMVINRVVQALVEEFDGLAAERGPHA